MRKVKLSEIAEINGGSTPSTKNEEYWNGEIVWLSPSDLPEIGEIVRINDSERKITRVGLNSCSAKLLDPDTVIFSSRASIGKIAINDIPVATNQGFINFTCGDEIDKMYLAYVLKYLTEDIVQLSNSTTFKEVSKRAIKDFKIPLTSLAEQKAIVAKLDRAQRLIDIDKAMLEKYDQLIQSVFLDMFGDPVKVSIDDDNTFELDELVDFQGGGTPSKKNNDFWGGEIPWVSPKDMKWTFITDSQDKITSAAIKESSTKLIKSGAVLSVVRSGILKNKWPLAINTVDVTLNQDMKALICSEKINNYFLLYYLKNYSRKVLGTVRGTTADNISTKVFKNIPIKLPELNKQLEFLRIVNAIIKEKKATKVKKSEELFSSLVQEVFG